MDKLSTEARSALMAKVRSSGNRSTEVRLRLALVRAGISGWKLHPKSIPGRPDFWFPRAKVVLFADGCFWHGCKRCLRLPRGNRRYWRTKISGNIRRSKKINRTLRDLGFSVLRVWEHDVKDIRKLDGLIVDLRHRIERLA